MSEPRTSRPPEGTPGTVPSFDPDCPPWDAIRDAEGHVWVHFYAGIWDRLMSTDMAARFVPAEQPRHLPTGRTAFTPGSIAGVVTARKRYRCGCHLCRDKHWIEAGERYVANALPPDNSEIGNDRWWHLRVCVECCPIEWAEAAS